jgi:dTDP-4-amino-4,6-dideoxygalactose transaminase
MTTGGEGGMATTNDETLWRKMWAYKDHGKSYEAVYEREHPSGFRWVHENFGSNFRMIEIQAAIGRIQLKRMSEWTAKRNEITQSILKAFEPFKVIRMPNFKCNRDCLKDCSSLSQCKHAQYKCYVYVDNVNLKEGWSRDRIIHEIEMRGAPCFQGGCSEVYLEKAFEGTSFIPKDRLPIANMLGDTSLMFLVHPTLTQENIKKMKEVIADVLKSASIK